MIAKDDQEIWRNSFRHVWKPHENDEDPEEIVHSRIRYKLTRNASFGEVLVWS
jgi:hypothetical protein